MMHPLSDIARDLAELQRLLALFAPGSRKMRLDEREWVYWAKTLADESSKDIMTSASVMLSAMRKVMAEEPEKLRALVSAFREKALKLEKRVNNAWYQPDPMGAFLVPSWEKPRKRRNEFQRRGRYAL